MHRHSFEHDGVVFAFLDAGGGRKPVLALHGHWMGGSDFQDLARDLAPDWRLVALDQRGFGETDHGAAHDLPSYVADAVALLDHLGIDRPVPVLGHSFGGIVAYHLAAARPDRVSAMIIEDIGVVLDDDSAPMVANWSGTFRLREDLEARLGPRLARYLQKSIRRVAEGWTLNFEPDEFLRSEQATNGDHWPVWLQSRCPALVVSGSESRVADGEEVQRMAERRNDTQFVRLKGGHSIHIDAPAEFAAVVRRFLQMTSSG